MGLRETHRAAVKTLDDRRDLPFGYIFTFIDPHTHGLTVTTMTATVCTIRPENIEQEVTAEKRPLLLLCMPRDDQFSRQLKLLEDIALQLAPAIKVGVVHEEFIEVFKKNYGFIGTPTFLLLVEGKEKGRLLGVSDRERLTDLILSSILVLND
ncbi:MAG: thioredoxin family protein [Deltaproteobacteria bacterium]|nr:thioredoxin family protein [Deltaproteobacteria bacterium]